MRACIHARPGLQIGRQEDIVATIAMTIAAILIVTTMIRSDGVG